MAQNAPAIRTTLQSLRVIHVILMLSILMYVYVINILPVANSEPLNFVFLWALGVVGLANIGLGQWIRSKQLGLAFEALRTLPEDTLALARWRRGVLISDCLAISTTLYGVVINRLGGSARQVAPFFIVGALAMLFWWPKEPEL